MDRNIMNKIYSDQRILNYLRYNPKWYKILYYAPERLNEFLDEAKESLKIRLYDKLEEFKGQLSFLSSLIEYINK